MLTLVQKINISKYSIKYKELYKECDHLCFLSKNLYNSTLYKVKQEYFKTNNYLNYYDINKIFTHSNQRDYRKLPAKVSKHTQMLVHQSFKSFFKLLKTKGIKHPRPPMYLDSIKGRQIVHYEKGACSFKQPGFIHLSKTNIFIPCQLKKEDVSFVRLVPKNNLITIEIGYRKKKQPKKKTGNIASIDLGLNNLITLTSNHLEPLIINGKPLKSINHHYNKQLSKEKSLLEIRHHKKNSKKINQLTQKRYYKCLDYLHKSTHYIMTYLVSGDIDTLIVGYNKGWKQNINMGKVNNQTFVSIPFYQLVQQLLYKCELLGIKCILQEESYTSKCSFLDNEDIKKQVSYLGKRIKRGLFQSSTGELINSDINGSLNIMKKYLIKQKEWNNDIYDELLLFNHHKPIKRIHM